VGDQIAPPGSAEVISQRVGFVTLSRSVAANGRCHIAGWHSQDFAVEMAATRGPT